MNTVELKGIEFKSVDEAVAYMNASPTGVAITLDNRAYVVEKAEAHRLEAAGVEFAYLHDHEMPDGSFRLVAVPVN